MEAKHDNVSHEDAERSASFVFSIPFPFFPAGAFQGDARRMSRVAASTEFGLPNSLVRGKPLIPLPPTTRCFIKNIGSNKDRYFLERQKLFSVSFGYFL